MLKGETAIRGGKNGRAGPHNFLKAREEVKPRENWCCLDEPLNSGKKKGSCKNEDELPAEPVHKRKQDTARESQE